MCDYTNGIRLCSCEPHQIVFRHDEIYRLSRGEWVLVPDKKNDNIPLIYIWQLFRAKSKEDSWMEIGRYMMPRDSLGKGLDAEWIALKLNVENCFDFEYDPVEGDNLLIRQNVRMGPYISFIFRSGQWTVDHYSPFDYEKDHVQSGVVREVEL
ncbi:hypothetical protein D3C87_95630 [compost metagenome]